MARITLFQHVDYQGPQVTLDTSSPDFQTIPFNDVVSSVKVESGVWQIFEHVNYEGRNVTLAAHGGPNGNGQYPSTEAMGGFNDQFSSVKLVYDA